MNANEQFIVKHYSEDERPILKGHGFDGLVIGDDRQEAQDFVDYLNSMLRQQQAEIESLKKQVIGDDYVFVCKRCGDELGIKFEEQEK